MFPIRVKRFQWLPIIIIICFLLKGCTSRITAINKLLTSFPGHNNMSNIISPTSLLLSATGTLAFKNCGLSDEVSTFTAPEMLQGRASSTKPAIERVSTHILKALFIASANVKHRLVQQSSVSEIMRGLYFNNNFACCTLVGLLT